LVLFLLLLELQKKLYEKNKTCERSKDDVEDCGEISHSEDICDHATHRSNPISMLLWNFNCILTNFCIF
jgi:hypothetical protein